MHFMKKLILASFVLFSIQLVNAQQRGDIVSFDSLQTYSSADFGAEAQQAIGFPPSILGIEYDFKVYRVRYYTQDYHPDSITIASALVTIPTNYPCSQLGIMTYGHGLTLKDGGVPSNNQNYNAYSLICKGMAANGFIGAAPDYIHMSQWSSPGPQAFIHARTEANCQVDLIRAIRQYCTQQNIQLSGHIFLSGYSQGGNGTVAAAQYMQEQYAGEFNVAAACAGGGSYDLSGICADSLSSTHRSTPERHSLPLVIRSLAVVYEDSLVAWNTGITKQNVIDTVFKAQYRTLMHSLLDRTDPFGDNSFLDSIPARMIEDSILFGFQSDPNHFFRRVLADNDIDDWSPQMPLVLYHSDADIENPYQNAVNTLQRFQQNGAADVTLFTVNGFTHPAAGQPHVLYTLNFVKSKRVDCLTSSVNDNLTEPTTSMNVSPNPSSDFIQVSFNSAINDNHFNRIKIFNTGLQLMAEESIENFTTIDIRNLSRGNYLIAAEDNAGNKIFRLISKM